MGHGFFFFQGRGRFGEGAHGFLGLRFAMVVFAFFFCCVLISGGPDGSFGGAGPGGLNQLGGMLWANWPAFGGVLFEKKNAIGLARGGECLEREFRLLIRFTSVAAKLFQGRLGKFVGREFFAHHCSDSWFAYEEGGTARGK